MTTGPAMTRDEARRAVAAGIAVARELVDEGHRLPADRRHGHREHDARSRADLRFHRSRSGRRHRAGDRDRRRDARPQDRRGAPRRCALHAPDPADPLGVVAAVGGFEHAALAGFVLGGAAAGVPVLLDGVNAGAAALVAARARPRLRRVLPGRARVRRAGPRPGAGAARAALRSWTSDLRLGEGTGALLALPLVAGAARALQDVATFDAAGVVDKTGD